jgi:hypothetical protein
MMVEAKEISHPGLARFGPGYQRVIRIDIMISSIIASAMYMLITVLHSFVRKVEEWSRRVQTKRRG